MIRQQNSLDIKPLVVIFGLCMTTTTLPTDAQVQNQYAVASVEDEQGQVLDDWIAHNNAILIKLNPQQSDSAQSQSQLNTAPQFQVFIGEHDVSSLFSFNRNQLAFKGDLPLPHGENTLEVKQFIDGEWQSIGSNALRVLSSAGFKVAAWQPRLEVSINSQLDERTSGDQVASDNPRFTDVTSSFGLSSDHQKDQLSIQSNFNLLSVSNRQQAVQFGTEGNQAAKLDLTDYAVNIKNGNHQLVLGHTSYGNNSLLIDNLSRRGIKWRYQNESSLSFSGALLNGTDIVGFDNFTGLTDYDEQHINALGFGINLFEDASISLRVEGSLIDAVKLADNDFGVGEISSAEKSKGLGFRFISSDKQERFDGELVIGLSRYSNPDDQSLSFGDELVSLTTETALAHNLNLSYILVQDWQSLWEQPVTLTLLFNDNKAEPLYQTLTAFVQANVENRMVGAQYQVGDVNGSLSTQTSQDNLDNILSLLTTRTESNNFSNYIPLAQILANENSESQSNSWMPNIDYNYQSIHQFAINSPEESISGFNETSHLPDQLTRSHAISANWQIEQNSVSLQSSYTDQDNRQIGRENADFISLQHSVSFNWQQNDYTNWSFSLGRNRQKDIELNKIQYSKTASVSFNWQSQSNLSLSINYGLSVDDDSLDEAKSTSTNADISLVKNIKKDAWWLPADGSISFRVNYNDSESIDRVFDQFNRFGTTIAQLGINLSFQ